MKIVMGEGKNNFIVEWNDNRDAEIAEEQANALSQNEQNENDAEISNLEN